MKQTIALQTPGRSDLDQSSLFSFDQFTAARPTAPVIHRDARFLLVRSGSGVIRLQGREYPLSAGSLAAILPWQISEIVRVDEPLACSVIAYHYDTVARAAHLFRGEDGQPMPMARLMETVPVLQLSPRQRAEAGRIADGLARELGLASLQEEGQLFSSLNAVSLLVQLTVLFARQALAADRPADAQGPDHRELLRYMYLHCGQKLTLQQLADVFGCSRSTVSARITAMTGLSFFDLLNEMRIGKTADYLLYTDLTLKELAEIQALKVQLDAKNAVYQARMEAIRQDDSLTEEEKAEQLAAIENWPETKKMLAVEYAMDRCGRDLDSDAIRRQLIYGIMHNCQGKHKYARNRIVIPGISEATFSRRKERFLHDIAKYAGLLVKGDTDSA